MMIMLSTLAGVLLCGVDGFRVWGDSEVSGIVSDEQFYEFKEFLVVVKNSLLALW